MGLSRRAIDGGNARARAWRKGRLASMPELTGVALGFVSMYAAGILIA
jgi:hypothetical protein